MRAGDAVQHRRPADHCRLAAIGLGFALVLGACGSTIESAGSASQQGGALGGDGLSLQEPGRPGGDPVTGTAPGAPGAPGAAAPGGVPTSATGNGASDTAPGGTAAPTASDPIRAPIQLGVLYAVNDGADQAGIENGNTFTLERAVRAYVTSYNETGGIGGRRIQPVFAEMHSASSNYEGQLQAACSAFTEDNHVAAVIAQTSFYSETLLNCLAKASVPLITGDWTAPDREAASRYPLFVTPTTLLGDTRVRALVSHLSRSGFLTRSSRVGVLVEDCPVNHRVHRNALLPALREAGVPVAYTYAPRCFQSLQDYGGQASDIQSAVLRFRQQRVDRVVVVSQGAEANILNLFATGASAQRYRPGYAVSSIAAVSVLAQNAPTDQMANVRGVGWLPAIDTQDPRQAAPTRTGERCLERMRRQGIRPSSNVDYVNIYGPCDAFGLYDALLRATHGDASAAAVLAALGPVGGDYVSASTVDGRVAVRDGRVGAAAGRLIGWVDGRFEYTSGSFRL